jgi:Zn-dependent protease
MSEQKTSQGAVWSLVLGIIGLLCLGPLTGVPAIICGHMARGNIRRSNGGLGGAGMALAGLLLGYVATVIMPLVAIATIAVFGVFGDRVRSQLEQATRELGSETQAVDSAVETGSQDVLKTLDKSGAR